MQSDPIVAKTRKLKAVWTPEFAQDLNAYHSIDAEAELTSMLSEYVSMEIDLELLDMLINGAVTTEYWSAVSNQFFDAANNKFVGRNVEGGGYYNTQGEWFQSPYEPPGAGTAARPRVPHRLRQTGVNFKKAGRI